MQTYLIHSQPVIICIRMLMQTENNTDADEITARPILLKNFFGFMILIEPPLLLSLPCCCNN